MTQPRLLADFAAVPTPRERRHARATNRAAQLDLFGAPIDDVALADDPLCPVCAGPHLEEQCPHGTAPTLELAPSSARTCYPCREHKHAQCPNHRVGTQGIIGRPCDCTSCDPPTTGDTMPRSTSAQRDENRLTDDDRAAMAAAVLEFARRTPTMGTGERYTTAERIAHRAIGCDERDLRDSELLEIRQIFKPILAANHPNQRQDTP